MPVPDMHDPSLPLLADLLDPESARAVIEAAFDDAGTSVSDVAVTAVSYRPGRRAIVRLGARLHAADGSSVDAAFTAWTGSSIPDGGVRLRSGGDEVALWRFPEDPRLPGLAVAATPALLEGVLGGLGLVGTPSITLRAYRPGRRAVVEVEVGGHRVFVKVVRPSRVAELQEIHAVLSPVVPVPRSHGWSPALGLVVLEPLPGRSLSQLLVTGAARLIPGPDDLTGLLDGFESLPVDGRRRTPSVGRAAEHAASLVAVVPDAAEALDEIVAAAGATDPSETITAHRDFHSGQLMVSEGRMGLVDIDTIGPGSRADDLAMFIAQVECLARPGPESSPVGEYVRVLREAWEPVVGRSVLAPRVAASLLGFAIGPFRVQASGWERETRRRIDVARSWVT